ncbi:hypothetical protein MMC14_000780 [Varicellaria rhodocarpa]|nr:hypothetical protein [Varicellaria rhodocarpa]
MRQSHSQSSDSSGSVNYYPDSSSIHQEISPRRTSTATYRQNEPAYNTIVPRQQLYYQYANEEPTAGSYNSSPSSIQSPVSIDDRTHQTAKQPKVYPCVFPGCPSQAQFKRLADLERHQNTVHFPKFIDCPLKWCGRTGKHGFTRKDHLKGHMREVHMKDIAKKSKQERK